MRAVSVRPGLLITDFAGVRIIIDEIPSGQQMSGKCGMVRIDAGIKDCDSDGAVRSSSFINLVS